MSAGSSIPYQLRPNKAVDRELFLSLLSRLGATLRLENYKYIGLGGPFLEDFRLLHARIGIHKMDCVEIELNVHNRQKFNKPIESINCIHSSLEEYLDTHDFADPIILWLDYTDPKTIPQQIQTFSRQVTLLPVRSVIRITMNANPASLGKPDDSLKIDELEWRLQRFKERLADYCPANLHADTMTRKNFGRTLLEALRLAVEKQVLDMRDRKIYWALATYYSDGQPMITATLIISKPGDDDIASILKNWEFVSEPKNPLVLDLPALSTLERLIMESSDNPKAKLEFELPKSDMNEDPFVSFKRFYRVFPHFSRVDL
jgi:hypothetical protein